MSLFGKIFKRTPESLQLSDWLANMTEAFLRMGDDTLGRDKASPDMLVCFTLINATHTAHNLLHTDPRIASNIGPIYAELRAYYECLWQLILLHQYSTPDEHDKISRLCGDVALRLERTMESLFKSNPNVKRALSEATGAAYERVMVNAVNEYIHGERAHAFPESGDHISDNIRALSGRIQRLGGLDSSQSGAVYEVLSQATSKAPSMTFLTQFNFSACKVLPDAFFR
ncbi:hypothetical protein Dthio_PD2193 [Desulfonatronospira thiodismutans ASO3-1]|uniref:Uncharacterized protein n=1 Tax=Desulfonatronospira thiodismutans ASO3-1 TaxID=555779 RepID=D6SPY4_9BACT|nr:hypothetical protein [Desulfonatronospira thiodismutans]EFI34810.1 hypothetical protein Dthio_PD2193 [Desulfonatronospira thiodismutans ASO3-1]